MFVGQGKMPGKTCSQQENAAGRHQHVRHFKSEFLSKAFINVGDPTTRKQQNLVMSAIPVPPTAPSFSPSSPFGMSAPSTLWLYL